MCSNFVSLSLVVLQAKGELFAGFCYLPTSRRINITVVKANLRSNSQLNASGSSIASGNGQSALQQGKGDLFFFLFWCFKLRPESSFRISLAQSLSYSHCFFVFTISLFLAAFYVRILMFQNGKLVRKKRSSASVKLVWGDNETIGFDLTDELSSDLTTLSFMLVLSYRTQCVQSPSSPEDEEPEIEHENESLIELDGVPRTRRSSSKTNKDRHIGHFVLDHDCWIEEVVKRPRKQVLKWFRLF